MSMDVKRWFILAAQIVIALAVGFPYMLSIIAGPLNADKGWAIPTLMLVFTICMWISSPAMVVFGILREKLGNRKLIILGGILYGFSVVASVLFSNVWGFVIVGGGIASFCMFGIFVAQLANVGVLFPDKRGLATGLYYAGQAFLFSASCVPLAILIEKMNVVPAIIIYGIVFGLITVILGIFAVDPPEGYAPKGWGPDEEEIETEASVVDYNWIQMLKTPLFYVLLLVLIGLMVGGMAISSNVSLMAQSALGISATKGAIFGTLYFIGVGVGGVVSGVLNDKLGGGKALLTLCVLSFIVVGIYLLFGQGVFFLFALVVLFVGLGYGGQGTAMAVITMNIWGEKHFGVNMGFVGVAGMISSAIGPVVAGAAEVNTTLIVILICNIVGVIAAFMFDRLSKSFVKKQIQNRRKKESA